MVTDFLKPNRKLTLIYLLLSWQAIFFSAPLAEFNSLLATGRLDRKSVHIFVFFKINILKEIGLEDNLKATNQNSII
jgi:hypothetical protein